MQTLNSKFTLPEKQFSFAGFDWPRMVAMLPRGTMRKRLERYKNPVCGPYYHAPEPVERGLGWRTFYLDSDFMPGMRWKWCDEVCDRIRHTGWFCDEYGDQTIRGLVFRLPNNRGFLHGWSMGESMASAIDTHTIYADEVTAAHAADSWAESVAEDQREYEDSERERMEMEEETEQ